MLDFRQSLINSTLRKVLKRLAGVPLDLIQPREPALPGLYPTRFTLIRPDQHVAWRGNTWPTDGHGLMRRIAGYGGMT